MYIFSPNCPNFGVLLSVGILHSHMFSISNENLDPKSISNGFWFLLVLKWHFVITARNQNKCILAEVKYGKPYDSGSDLVPSRTAELWIFMASGHVSSSVNAHSVCVCSSRCMNSPHHQACHSELIGFISQTAHRNSGIVFYLKSWYSLRLRIMWILWAPTWLLNHPARFFLWWTEEPKRALL